MMQLSATIVITTRNRRKDVVRAVESSVAQVGDRIEVLVYDDASDDGTSEAIRDDFPEVRIVRSEPQVGYIVLRNRGFREARGDIVFSLDDDAYYTDAGTVTSTVELFLRYPEAAAISLPYVEPSWRGASMHPTKPEMQLRSYVGCAHAVRRSAVLECGGYRDLLVHQGEERDLCIRLLDAGHMVIYGDAGPIVHCPSQSRDRGRMSYFGYRNTILFAAFNVPHPYAFPRAFLDTFQLIRHRFFSPRYLITRLSAILAGWAWWANYPRQRKPVSIATYRKFRVLPGHGPMQWDGCTYPKPLTRRLRSENSIGRL